MTRSDPITPPPGDPAPLHAARLTWAALLGRWVDFARSALALPDDALGRRLRDAVPDIIALQAVWFALAHLEELPDDQRRLGLDRAEVLIERHAAALDARWRGEPLPAQLLDLVHDAREQLRAARAARAPGS